MPSFTEQVIPFSWSIRTLRGILGFWEDRIPPDGLLRQASGRSHPSRYSIHTPPPAPEQHHLPHTATLPKKHHTSQQGPTLHPHWLNSITHAYRSGQTRTERYRHLYFFTWLNWNVGRVRGTTSDFHKAGGLGPALILNGWLSIQLCIQMIYTVPSLTKDGYKMSIGSW